MEVLEVILVALYLPGSPHGANLHRRYWNRVAQAIRRESPSIEQASEVLLSAGLWMESRAVSPCVLEWAADQVGAGKALAACSESYPGRLMSCLAESSPPAFWQSGPPTRRPLFTIVGAREIGAYAEGFVRECAAALCDEGYAILSGGAPGTDRAAAAAAGEQAIEILPYGLSRLEHESNCALSIRPLDEEFNIGAAMERNALLYAGSSHALVIEPKFKKGGTWHGAVEALRRRLCTVLVPQDGSQASRALIALGAKPVTIVETVLQALAEGAHEMQGSLAFG